MIVFPSWSRGIAEAHDGFLPAAEDAAPSKLEIYYEIPVTHILRLHRLQQRNIGFPAHYGVQLSSQ
jgi:hypothetical protein